MKVSRVEVGEKCFNLSISTSTSTLKPFKVHTEACCKFRVCLLSDFLRQLVGFSNFEVSSMRPGRNYSAPSHAASPSWYYRHTEEMKVGLLACSLGPF